MSYCQYLEGINDPNMADYSVGVCNLPRDISILKIEEDIRDLFEKLSDHNRVEFPIHNVFFLFETHDYLKLLENRNKLKNELFEFKERTNLLEWSENSYENLQAKKEIEFEYFAKIENLNNEILKIENELIKALKNGKITRRFTGKAVVIFKTELAAKLILEQYDVEFPYLYQFILWLIYLKNRYINCSRNTKIGRIVQPILKSSTIDLSQCQLNKKRSKIHLYYKHHKLYIIKSVNSHNLIWKNFGYTFYQKYFFRIGFFSFSLMILAFSFFLIRTTNNRRFEYIKEHDIKGFSKFILNGIISLLILTFNNVLNQFILHTIQFEWHEKKTNERISQVRKIVLKMFLNTTVMIFLLCFNNGNFDQNFFIYQVLMFNSITALVSPLVGFWDFSYFLKLAKRSFVLRDHNIKKTQDYMNKLYENPEYNIVLNYSSFIFQFINLHFYCIFFPFWTFLLVLVHFIHGFLIHKYVFITRYSVTNEFRNEVNAAVLDIIDFAPILVLFGQYFKSLVIFSESILSGFFWIKVVLAIWTLAFPNEKLIDYFFTKNKPDFIEFDRYKNIFKNWNCDNDNPAYFSLKREQNIFC